MALDGTWEITTKTPMGDQKATLDLKTDGGALTGVHTAMGASNEIYDATVDGQNVAWKVDVQKPFSMTVECAGTVDGDSITGEARPGTLPAVPFSGTRTG
jgi:hypothetical protein